MAQTIDIPNFSTNNLIQQTRLAADVASGVPTIAVQNNAGFANSDFVIIGTPGSDSTEMLTILSKSAASGITFTANLSLKHSLYDFVNSLFGDKIIVYRAANSTGLQPADTDFAVLDTISIQPDQAYTRYTDADGSSSYWYKFTYKNSASLSETNLADSKAVRGGGAGDYCSIAAIREEAGFKTANFITDEMIDVKRQAAQDEINGTLHGFYVVPFQVPVNQFITDICRRLAAGLLLLEQYGEINNTETSSGKSKRDGARADLAALAEKQKVLTDQTGQSLALPGATGGISGWPNSTTDATARSGGGAPRLFRMGDIQGQPASTDSDGNTAGNAYYGRKW